MNEKQIHTEIAGRFKHYPPTTQDEIKIHEEIRAICKEAADALASLLPENVVRTREFSQTLTDLENAMMHANAAYARNK